jgi:energy-coupling factor transporter ATP-binding protein EcfA2
VSVWNKYSEIPFTSLSGGQFRKVLLAKMFYSQKPIYVFDEPTDSIDPESAFKIFKHINEIPHAQMIIFITHDVQRLQLASNKVLVLKDGEVIEFGETTKLIKDKKSQLNKALATYTQTIRE